MSDIEQLIRSHLELVTQDFPCWLELLDDEIVIEFPYGESAGNPARMGGKDEITEVITTFLARVPELRFRHPVIYLCADPDEAFATYDVEVNVPENNRVYRQNYISYFRQRSGKLVYLAEYFDPIKTRAAFND